MKTLTCDDASSSRCSLFPSKKAANLEPERVRVGQTLRTLREIRGYKLGEFAGALGISYAYLSNIEAGRKRLTPQLLARAADVLDVKQASIVRPDLVDEDVA